MIKFRRRFIEHLKLFRRVSYRKNAYITHVNKINKIMNEYKIRDTYIIQNEMK